MTDTSRFTSHASRNTPYPIPNLQSLLLLLAFTLRLFRLDFQELRGDEAFGYFFSLRAFDDIIAATLLLQEPHPVGSYFLQHLWLGWVGHSEFALRFVSVWFGTLAVALLYRLARRLELSASTASVAALLLAASPYAIWHSQDARMYSILLALTLASTWLMIEALQRGRWTVWLVYVAVGWLALHTHYFAIFVLAAQSCFVIGRALLMSRVRFAAAQWVQWQFVLGLFYLPWFFTASETLTGYGGNGDSPGFWAMTRRSLAVFAAGESIPSGWRAGVAIGAGLLILLGAFHLWRAGGSRRRTLFLLLLLWLMPVLATWASSQNRPIFNERYLIAAAPSFYLLLGVALTFSLNQSLYTRIEGATDQPKNPSSLLSVYTKLVASIAPGRGWEGARRNTLYAIRYLPPFFIGSLLIVSLSNRFFHPAYSQNRGWRELAGAFGRFSADLPTEAVRVAQNFPDPTIWYYYRGPVKHVVLPPAANDAEGAAKVVSQLAADGVTRVILPVQPAAWWDGSTIASAALAQKFTLTARLPVGVWPLEIYSRAANEFTPLAAEFANGLRLTGVALKPESFVPGGLLVVHLRWDGEGAALSGGETVFVHLLNSRGEILGQRDLFFPSTAYGILLPDNPPPGPYRLIAGLYDPSLPGAPRIGTIDRTDFVELGVLDRKR